MSLRFVGDQVLVRLDEMAEQSAGTHGASIVLSDSAKDYPTTGTILAVGPGLETKRGFKATTLRKGQRVMLSFRPGHDMFIDGVPHTIAHEFSATDSAEGILAVLDE